MTFTPWLATVLLLGLLPQAAGHAATPSPVPAPGDSRGPAAPEEPVPTPVPGDPPGPAAPEEPVPAPVPGDPPGPATPDPLDESAEAGLTLEGSLVEIAFHAGRVFVGRVVSMDDTQLKLDTFSGLLITVELSQIKAITEKKPAEFNLLRVETIKGETLTGGLVSFTSTEVGLKLAGGAVVTLQRAAIKTMNVNDRTGRLAAPRAASPPGAQGSYRALRGSRRAEVIPSHRTRYLYAPTAMPLRKGEGYFSQKELIFSAAAFGVTDQLSMLVGSIVPALMFGGAEGANGILAVKYAWKPGERLHVALATEVLVLPGGEVAGLGGAVMTFGGYHDHLSLLAYAPYSLNGNTFKTGSFLFTVAGALRTGRRWALLTENWLVGLGDADSGGEAVVVGSLGLRRFGLDHAFDFALVGISGVGFGFPWVDWTFSWGHRDVNGRPVYSQTPSAPPMVGQTSFATWQRERAEIGLR